MEGDRNLGFNKNNLICVLEMNKSVCNDMSE